MKLKSKCRFENASQNLAGTHLTICTGFFHKTTHFCPCRGFIRDMFYMITTCYHSFTELRTIMIDFPWSSKVAIHWLYFPDGSDTWQVAIMSKTWSYVNTICSVNPQSSGSFDGIHVLVSGDKLINSRSKYIADIYFYLTASCNTWNN